MEPRGARSPSWPRGPVEGELAGGAAGEPVEVEGRLPLLAPLPLLLLGELVVEGQADVQRVLLRLREPQGEGPSMPMAQSVG